MLNVVPNLMSLVLLAGTGSSFSVKKGPFNIRPSTHGCLEAGHGDYLDSLNNCKNDFPDDFFMNKNEKAELDHFNRNLDLFIKEKQKQIDQRFSSSLALVHMSRMLDMTANGSSDLMIPMIKEQIMSAGYNLLPQLLTTLEAKRMSQIQSIAESLKSSEYNAFLVYITSYLTIKIIDFNYAAYSAAFLMKQDISPELSYQMMQNYNRDFIIQSFQGIKSDMVWDSLWFENIKHDDLMPEEVKGFFSQIEVPIDKKQPAQLASSLSKEMSGLIQLIKDCKIDGQVKKYEWELSQSLVIYHMITQSDDLFIRTWKNLYSWLSSHSLDVGSEQMESFNELLLSHVGISYYGTNPEFQRSHKDASGIFRTHDYFALYLRNILEFMLPSKS